MATSLLEKMRALHEDIERCQRMIVQLRMAEPRTHKDKITCDLKVNKYLELIQDRSNKLRAIYEDKDNLRRDGIARITGQGPEVFSVFYDTMREMRAYYAKFPNMTFEKPDEVAYKLVMEDDELSQFTGEESFGRFLDLHEHYVNFLNLKHNKGKAIDYIDYLKSLHTFDSRLDIKDQHYRNYLQNLLEYLVSWYRRAKPLVDVGGFIKQAEELVEKCWNNGNWSWESAEQEEKEQEEKAIKMEVLSEATVGMPKGSTTDLDAIDDAPPLITTSSLEDIDDGPVPVANESANGNGAVVKAEKVVKIEIPDDQPIDLKRFNSAKELEAVGLERLKKELQRVGLICGGTVEERAARLFLLKDLPLESLNPALLAKPGNKNRRRKKGKKAENAKNNQAFHKQVVVLESKVRKLVINCQDKIEATKQHVEKKQSRTVDEILAELEEEEGSDVEAESEEEEEVIIGKQNYPVGWDGKPIPYWLYKLHGLGIEYQCEICGGQSYQGRRAFERHFQEWRHAHGMRCLGIPNTKHFHEITKIKDAQDLWEKLKEDQQTAQWRPEEEEEYEDAEGNVYAKKTFELLKKQGLLDLK